MRFKRTMAASMAAVMAVSSAVVCQVTASAASSATSSALFTVSKSDPENFKNLVKPFGTNDCVKKINKIVLNVTAESSQANGEFYLNAGDDHFVQLYYNQSKKANNVNLKGGEATDVTLDVSTPITQWWHELKIQADWGSIDVNSISAYDGDTLIAKIDKPKFDNATKVMLTEIGYCMEGSAAIELSGVSNPTDLVNKYPKVTVKVPILGAFSRIDDSEFDPAGIQYTLKADINYGMMLQQNHYILHGILLLRLQNTQKLKKMVLININWRGLSFLQENIPKNRLLTCILANLLFWLVILQLTLK